MASVRQPQLRSNARAYFAQFDYPITSAEATFWQSPFPPQRHPARSSSHSERSEESSSRRKKYFAFSQPKWTIAKRVGETLSRIPTIQAIFVTGALSMDNCPEDDDIDLMIITSSHTLWITRAIVVLYLTLRGLRRPPSLPEHSSPRVKDKICDNLYLDLSHLAIEPSSHTALYLAHEILQSKCLFDRSGVHHKFLSQNSWAKKYLPVAYKSQMNSVILRLTEGSSTNYFLYLLNFLFFKLQYLYMRPKLTRERVGLGHAFFHPRKTATNPSVF